MAVYSKISKHLCSTFFFADFFVPECKDERDCQWIVTETQKYGMELSEYCEIYKDAASVKQCRKTCGMCKFNITFKYIC